LNNLRDNDVSVIFVIAFRPIQTVLLLVFVLVVVVEKEWEDLLVLLFNSTVGTGCVTITNDWRMGVSFIIIDDDNECCCWEELDLVPFMLGSGRAACGGYTSDMLFVCSRQRKLLLARERLNG